jgi:hypothetical protein
VFLVFQYAQFALFKYRIWQIIVLFRTLQQINQSNSNMNTINFEHIFAYFQGSPQKSFYRRFTAFAQRHRNAFEALTRVGQPFGGSGF